MYLRDGKFTLFANEAELNMFEKNAKSLNSDEKYRLWMQLRLNDLKQLMLDYLGNSTSNDNLKKTTTSIRVLFFINF